MIEPTYERTAQLLEAELGDELVALDAAAGNCFGFNAVAASVWRYLEQPRTLTELHTALLAEYDVDAEQCGQELRELLADLTEQGLVRRVA
ncbi:MAG: PqqD family protein [Sphingomonas bacterium]|nr:PqqD family protein [Sphingomonas bacterium]